MDFDYHGLPLTIAHPAIEVPKKKKKKRKSKKQKEIKLPVSKMTELAYLHSKAILQLRTEVKALRDRLALLDDDGK